MNEKDKLRMHKVIIEGLEKELYTTSAFTRVVTIGLIARTFREEGELQNGDKVQVQCDEIGSGWHDGIFIGYHTTYADHAYVYIPKVSAAKAIHIDSSVRLKPKTEKRLKDSCATMHFFDDNGWLPDALGVFRPIPDNGRGCAFYPGWWQYCEWKIEDIPIEVNLNIISELIEEVEVL